MIGYEPFVERMVVIDGQDFSHFFGADPTDPFPANTTVTLKIYDRDNNQLGAWPAITNGSTGSLVQIDADDLRNIPDSAHFRVFVNYSTGQTLCWYRGRVWRRV